MNAITSKSMSRAEVRTFLRMFRFADIEATLNLIVLNPPHVIENLYGTGVRIKYHPDGNRWYVSILAPARPAAPKPAAYSVEVTRPAIRTRQGGTVTGNAGREAAGS